jgi:sulfatase modifying factor 1
MKTTIGLAAMLFFTSMERALGDTFGGGASTFAIEFAAIGNPGNAADITGNPNPAGKVGYGYRIGQFEISEQMIDKANALGGLDIAKDTRGPDKPATSVSWNEAARFVNWLNTSTGSTPAYKFAVQPGEVGYSANADIELWTISDAGYNPSNRYRNSLARYFLPSAHEWYKAAYYDPTSGVYYNYPTGSDNVPDGLDFAGDPNFDAVFTDGIPILLPNDITNVGVLSPYGTAGQGGNIWEWEETDSDLVNDSSSPTARGVRGGHWLLFSSARLSSSDRLDGVPTLQSDTIGFRVASIAVPEPSTLNLFTFIAIASLAARHRKMTSQDRIQPAPRSAAS